MPEGYEGKCHELKVIQRSRAIKKPEDLMKLSLIYLSQSCSLLEVSELSKAMGIAEISDVAFMKKFGICNEWFKWILSQIKIEPLMNYAKPEKLEKYRLISVDATTVSEKGATKRNYKLHYGIELFTLSSSNYKITPETTGESLRNFSIEPNDLVIADRAYGTKTSIEYCLESGADFIFRMKNKAFKLYDVANVEVDLLSFLNTTEEAKASEIIVYMKGSKGMIPLRLCAIKKTDEEIEKTKKRLKDKESKKQKKYSDQTKITHHYIFVLSSLPDFISTDEILDIYRLRWQVELYFKRLKSIMNFGELPKKKEESILAWLNGKLMVALLLEVLLAKAVFPPDEIESKSEEYLARS